MSRSEVVVMLTILTTERNCKWITRGNTTKYLGDGMDQQHSSYSLSCYVVVTTNYRVISNLVIDRLTSRRLSSNFPFLHHKQLNSLTKHGQLFSRVTISLGFSSISKSYIVIVL